MWSIAYVQLLAVLVVLVGASMGAEWLANMIDRSCRVVSRPIVDAAEWCKRASEKEPS